MFMQIPPTRAISPKLGRQKGSGSESGSPRVGCRSPRSPLASNEKATKGSLSKSSLSRAHTPQESTMPAQVQVEGWSPKPFSFILFPHSYMCSCFFVFVFVSLWNYILLWIVLLYVEVWYITYIYGWIGYSLLFAFFIVIFL